MCHITNTTWACGHSDRIFNRCEKSRLNPVHAKCLKALETWNVENHIESCKNCASKRQYRHQGGGPAASRERNPLPKNADHLRTQDELQAQRRHAGSMKTPDLGEKALNPSATPFKPLHSPKSQGRRPTSRRSEFRSVELQEDNGVVDWQVVRNMGEDPNCGNPRDDYAPAGRCTLQ